MGNFHKILLSSTKTPINLIKKKIIGVKFSFSFFLLLVGYFILDTG